MRDQPERTSTMERNDGLRKFLLMAPVYRGAQRLIGGPNAARRVTNEVVRSSPNTSIVDIGCGTADIADHLEFASYVGFDPNPPYVEQAQLRLGAATGGRAKVFVGSIGDPELEASLPGSADLVMAMGVLHHLDDSLADSALALAARLAGTTGRFVSLDPGYADGQPKLARFLASRDRGQHVRTATAIEALVGRHFSDVRITVHHDLLRVPYTHVAVDARNG